MRKYIYNTFLLAGAILLGACNDSGNQSGGQDQDSPAAIGFAATRADGPSPFGTGDFPNGGSVGIVAGYYNQYIINWKSYPDIDNVRVTADDEGNGRYGFLWTETKYWPMDNTALSFMVYSPWDGDSNAVNLSPDNTTLEITLQADMPDVLYASGNDRFNAWSKGTTIPADPVNLGEFRHAMSQLTIVFAKDETANPAVTVSSLRVSTGNNNARLHLPSGDSGLTLGPDGQFSYSPITANTPFYYRDSVSRTVLLFPGTEDVTEISFTLVDGTYSYPLTYDITDFGNTTPGADPADPITLQRGRNTVLTILVKGTEVEHPDAALHLKGLVTDWVEWGDYEVIIN